MKKVCWMDTETTGLNPTANDIIQLALIIEIDGSEKERREFLMQPFNYATIQPQALAVNGVTLEQLKKYPDPRETFIEIKNVLSKYVNKFDKMDKFSPAGYNVQFDTGFLQQFFLKNDDKFFGSWFDYKYIDPMVTLKTYVPLSSYKLTEVCKHYKIPHSAAHTAMSDIDATKKLHELINDCIRFDIAKLEEGYEQFCKRRGESASETVANRGGSRS